MAFVRSLPSQLLPLTPISIRVDAKVALCGTLIPVVALLEENRTKYFVFDLKEKVFCQFEMLVLFIECQ